jgi:hypothetical protein
MADPDINRLLRAAFEQATGQSTDGNRVTAIIDDVGQRVTFVGRSTPDERPIKLSLQAIGNSVSAANQKARRRARCEPFRQRVLGLHAQSWGFKAIRSKLAAENVVTRIRDIGLMVAESGVARVEATADLAARRQPSPVLEAIRPQVEAYGQQGFGVMRIVAALAGEGVTAKPSQVRAGAGTRSRRTRRTR